jgi:hypothetical protein
VLGLAAGVVAVSLSLLAAGAVEPGVGGEITCVTRSKGRVHARARVTRHHCSATLQRACMGMDACSGTLALALFTSVVVVPSPPPPPPRRKMALNSLPRVLGIVRLLVPHGLIAVGRTGRGVLQQPERGG